MQTKKLLSILLTLALTLGLLALAPITAQAAPASINIASLGATYVSSPLGDDAWVYNPASNNTLYLTASGGSYTLAGTNANLYIMLQGTTSPNPSITLNGAHITAPSVTYALSVGTSSTLTLIGANSLTSGSSISAYMLAYNAGKTTISGSGSLTVMGTVSLNNKSTMAITGNATVTAVGGAGKAAIVQITGSNILLGDNAKLTMTCNSAGGEYHTIEMADTTTTHRWRVTGDAGIDEMVDESVSIDIGPGGTATVERVPMPVASAGSVNRTSDTAATIGFTASMAGTAYYLVVNSGAAAPTSSSVKLSGNSLGAVVAGANSGKAVTLTAGAKDIYVVIVDADGFLGAPLKIAAAAYVPPGTAPTITTASLPGGVVGTAYNQTLAATGSTPITWSIASGTLPTGLSLNASTGAITGTPSVVGTYNFTVKAANGTAPDATKALSITVNAASVNPVKMIKLWGKTTTYVSNFGNWLLCILCFGWIWMAF